MDVKGQSIQRQPPSHRMLSFGWRGGGTGSLSRRLSLSAEGSFPGAFGWHKRGELAVSSPSLGHHFAHPHHHLLARVLEVWSEGFSLLHAGSGACSGCGWRGGMLPGLWNEPDKMTDGPTGKERPDVMLALFSDGRVHRIDKCLISGIETEPLSLRPNILSPSIVPWQEIDMASEAAKKPQISDAYSRSAARAEEVLRIELKGKSASIKEAATDVSGDFAGGAARRPWTGGPRCHWIVFMPS